MVARPMDMQDAWAALGLAGAADPADITRAFRAAAKAARPENHDGDERPLRRVVAAWSLVKPYVRERPAAMASMPPSPPVIVVTPVQALKGGTTTMRLGDRTLKVRITRGVRTGDPLRLKGGAEDGGDLKLPVLIRGDDALNVIGDDLYMTWPVSPRVVEDGGRVEIHTHAGPRSAWLVAGQTTLCLRLKDLGLPARRKRPQGHLFVTLIPSADAPSATEDRLAQFTRVWTPDRLAA